jgi:hypothetical protein
MKLNATLKFGAGLMLTLFIAGSIAHAQEAPPESKRRVDDRIDRRLGRRGVEESKRRVDDRINRRLERRQEIRTGIEGRVQTRTAN